jgi:hypothetical protein
MVIPITPQPPGTMGSMILVALQLAGTVAGPALAWQGWSEAPFDRARRARMPVALLVSDSLPATRQVEDEALGDPETVSLLDRGYVAVRVDREERPDVAEIYAQAIILMESEGGRPAVPYVAVLSPEGRPLGGSSLWREGRAYRRGLAALLFRLSLDYRERREELEAKGGVTTLALRQAQAPDPPRGALGPAVVEKALRGLLESFDPRRARFGVAPGLPPPGALRFLLAEHARTGGVEPLRVADACLAALARSGLPDSTGGAPRLASNALLLAAFVHAHELTGQPSHREAAATIARWAMGALRTPEGVFRASGPGAGPAADERVFLGANGLMIGALARAGSALGRKRDVEAARAAAAFIMDVLGPPPSFPRYVLGAERRGSAFLEDYALLAEGLLHLGEATGDRRWRAEATTVVEVAAARFLDTSAGGFFETDAAHGPLIARLRNGFDLALPSGNGVMASVLQRLSRATGETRFAELARRTVTSFLPDLEQAPRGLETLAAAASAMVGPPSSAAREELPSRLVGGAVEVEASLSAARARPGDAVEARVRLKIAEGWRVNAHEPAPGFAGLTVSVPSGAFLAAPPRYPAPAVPGTRGGSEPSYFGEVTVTVPLRVPAAAPGQTRVRLRVGFQACRGRECRAPDSALLEVPLVVTPP